MLGKTFKGLTDAMLAWQTERLLELAVEQRGLTSFTCGPSSWSRSRSTACRRRRRYPGGVALRFARVLRYRDGQARRRGRHLAAVLAVQAP